MKGGEPGGQSTGSVFQSDDSSKGSSLSDWRRRMASQTMAHESPRFEPKAAKARIGLGEEGLLETQDIFHVVKSGFLADNPFGSSQRAVGESLTAGRFVAKFQPFAVCRKDDGMIPDH